MNKEFIPYEEALALKELGFDELCMKAYAEGDPKYEPYTLHRMIPDINNSDVEEEDCICTAPLYQQAFRWFREKGFNFSIDSQTLNHNLKYKDYHFSIDKEGEYLYRLDHRDGFGTYAKAELACLKKLIELVEEK